MSVTLTFLAYGIHTKNKIKIKRKSQSQQNGIHYVDVRAKAYSVCNKALDKNMLNVLNKYENC